MEYVRVGGAWFEGSGSSEGGGDESCEGEEGEVHCKVSLVYFVKSEGKVEDIFEDDEVDHSWLLALYKDAE
jgi:hypothetical protein